ncbi:integrase catalytic domain-containing protein [Trichonephila clavipes]|nr:integrase catalytic domain-containing protein [Trichonephila clavipes]
MYVDDWIKGQDTREALFMSRHAKNIMKVAGMEMRKWISNNTALMDQMAAEGFDTHPMDASIRLGTNRTKVLGIAWQTLDNCLTLDTKDHFRIPRLVLDSTNNDVSDLIEIHIFCDASKLGYGAAAYVKVRKQNEVHVNLIISKTRVAPLKAVTLPRLELLGALVAALLSSSSSKRWKQSVANRVRELSQLTDPDSWFHCSGQDNPSDFLSRVLSVDTLISNNKWRNGPDFLRTDELPENVSECPELNEAIYLEIIRDLTSQALIAALKRFISRSGKCHKIFSDNDSNMIGANREIKALSKLVRNREESLFAFFAEGIEWSFCPPRSPNWGSQWEANIKSLKYYFKHVAGNSKFSYKELLTLITQIEAILNSRPLTPLSSDVDDLEVLTPDYFLIGGPFTAIVEPSLLQCESNRLNV